MPGEIDQLWPGTKNHKTHSVPLSGPAIAILDTLAPREKGQVFPNGRGGYIKIPVTINIWKELGIRRFRPHHLRATAASHMDALGISQEHLSRVINHATKGSAVTASYIRHDFLQQKRHALETWAAHLTTVVEGHDPRTVIPIRAQQTIVTP